MKDFAQGFWWQSICFLMFLYFRTVITVITITIITIVFVIFFLYHHGMARSQIADRDSVQIWSVAMDVLDREP
jgi:uncharacterized membrane protein